ncbi:hypothetical protein DH2020_025135 [Rehmannia glutinosa]|uniref:H/ACA ribonucleoprotein complex non-core subunit NAF1 n=1 Tax=Rehmannia glutinosa TaxID=99300 RepID=A0ABR0W0I2_REHGL
MEENPELCGDPNMADLGGNPADFGSCIGELEIPKENLEVSGDGISQKVEVKEELLGLGQEKEETRVVERSVEMGSEKINVEGVLSGDESGRKLGDLGCMIEKQLEKVSLDGNLGSDMSFVSGGDLSKSGEMVNLDGSIVMGMNGNGMKVDETVGDEDESDSNVESDGESSSSSSSSSSSGDSSSSSSSGEEEEEDEDSGAMSGEKTAKNEEGIVEEQIDIEEGEIMLSDAENTIAWSDNEDVEDDGGGIGVLGPITSKNELKDLPPVPPVTVTLQPHHQTLPVGVILSIIGAQVIVEGVEKHNPLNEGSILWITESRSPLGIIDEIFGPVKNPYYIVRYNSEDEVPGGIQQGTLEAEHRRMLKMKKRGTNESKPGMKRKDKRQQKNQTGNWNNRNRAPAPQTPSSGDKMPVTENQHFVPPITASLNQDNFSGSSGLRQDLSGNQAMIPPFPHMAQAPGFRPPNGIWNNGFPHQQQQSMGLPNGMPANGMLWMQQNGPFQLYQTPFQPNMAFQQQMSTIPGLPLNFNALGGQSNFGGGPTLHPWPTSMDQNMLNTSQFGMGLQAQHVPLPLNGGGEQAGQAQGSQISHNSQESSGTLNFNRGRGGGGRRGNHRGRGRFGGGRGRYQSRQ